MTKEAYMKFIKKEAMMARDKRAKEIAWMMAEKWKNNEQEIAFAKDYAEDYLKNFAEIYANNCLEYYEKYFYNKTIKEYKRVLSNGLMIGLDEGRNSLASLLFFKNISPETIADILHVPVEEVREWIRERLNREYLNRDSW